MMNPNSNSTAEYSVVLISLSLSNTRVRADFKNITDRSGSVEVGLQEKTKLAPRENSSLKKKCGPGAITGSACWKAMTILVSPLVANLVFCLTHHSGCLCMP